MKFLVLNCVIRGYSGSEINALQLCEGLRGLGYDADIGTFFLASPMKELLEQRNIKVINLLTDSDEVLDYDVIWSHHSPVLAQLLFHKNVKNPRILHSCLSPILPLESPPSFHEVIPLFLSYSSKNSEVMVHNGVQPEIIYHFPNYSPRSFFSAKHKAFPNKPNNIAVVSNHPPDELSHFAEKARMDQINIDFIGLGNQVVYVNDKLLQKYDLVISIGKTVFYCFALRIPVYCYDHFGGSGYITLDNYEINKNNNFSGRGINRKVDGETLYKDIIANYQKQLPNLTFLYKQAQMEFNLETNLERLSEKIQTLPTLDIEQFRTEHSLDERIYDTIIGTMNRILYYMDENHKLGEQIINLENEVGNRNEQINQLANENNYFSKSKSWRITRPLRFIGNLFRRS